MRRKIAMALGILLLATGAAPGLARGDDEEGGDALKVSIGNPPDPNEGMDIEAERRAREAERQRYEEQLRQARERAQAEQEREAARARARCPTGNCGTNTR